MFNNIAFDIGLNGTDEENIKLDNCRGIKCSLMLLYLFYRRKTKNIIEQKWIVTLISIIIPIIGLIISTLISILK